MALQPLGPQTREKYRAAGQDPDKFRFDDVAETFVPYNGTNLSGASAAFLEPIVGAPGEVATGNQRMVEDVSNALPEFAQRGWLQSQLPAIIAGAVLKKSLDPSVEALRETPRTGSGLEHLTGIAGGLISGLAPLAAGPAGIPAAGLMAAERRYGATREQGGGVIPSALAAGVDAAAMAIPPLRSIGRPMGQVVARGAAHGLGVNAAAQGAQNIIADQSYAPGTPLGTGMVEAGLIGTVAGAGGSALSQRAHQSPLLNMGGSDNYAAANAPQQAPPVINPYARGQAIMAQLKRGVDDIGQRQALMEELLANSPLRPDQVQAFLPPRHQVDPQAFIQAIRTNPAEAAKVGAEYYRHAAKLVADGFNPTDEQLLHILNAANPAEAARQVRVASGPETVVRKTQDAFDARTQQAAQKLAAESDANTFKAVEADAAENAAANAARDKFMTEKVTAAQRAQDAARKAREDHLAEIAAAERQAAQKLAAERDAIASIKASAKAQGIIVPDAFVGVDDVNAYVNERLKLRGVETKNALKNPDLYGPDTIQTTPLERQNAAEQTGLAEREQQVATEDLEKVAREKAAADLRSAEEAKLQRDANLAARELAAKQKAEAREAEEAAKRAKKLADEEAYLKERNRIRLEAARQLREGRAALIPKKPEATVPEKPATVKAQVDLAADPASSKPAALVTPGEVKPPVPNNLETVPTSRGELVVNPEKVAAADAVEATEAGKGGEVLGLSQKTKPEGATEVVTARNPDGTVVSDEVVTPAKVPAAVEAAKKVAPAAEVEVRPAADALKERVGVPAPSDDAAANNAAQLEAFRKYQEAKKGKPVEALKKEIPKGKFKKAAPKEPAELTSNERAELDVLETADNLGTLNAKQAKRLKELQDKHGDEGGTSSEEGGTPVSPIPKPRGLKGGGTGSEPSDTQYHVTTNKKALLSGDDTVPHTSKFKRAGFHVFDNMEDAQYYLESLKKQGHTGAEIVPVKIPKNKLKPDNESLGRAWYTDTFNLEFLADKAPKPVGIGSGFKPGSKKSGEGGFVDIPGRPEVTRALRAVERVYHRARRAIDTPIQRLRTLEGGEFAADKLQRLAEKREQLHYEAQNILATGLRDTTLEDQRIAGQYRADIAEYGASPIVPTPGVQRSIDAFDNLANFTHYISLVEGPQILDNGVYRDPIQQPGYTPAVLRDDIWTQIRQGDPAIRQEFINHQIANGMDPETAARRFIEMSDESPTVVKGQVDFGPLRRPEGITYPREWLKSPVESWLNYLNKWSADVAFSNIIEQDPQMANLHGNLNNSRGGTHVEDLALRDNLEVGQQVQSALKSFALSISPKLNLIDRAHSLATGAMVQHGSAIKDVLLSLPSTWAQTDIRNMTRALTEVLTPGSFNRGRERGYIPSFYRSNPELATQHMNTGLARIAANAVDWFRTNTGLHAAQDFTRLMGSFAGEFAATDALAARNADYFHRLDIKDPFTRPPREVIQEAANRTQKNVTSSYDFRDVPTGVAPGSENQVARLFFGLSRFALGQTNRQLTFAGRALKQGDISPLLKMATGGLLTAAASDALVEALFKKKPSDMTWSEWMNLDNPESMRFLVNQAAGANLGGLVMQLSANLANYGTGARTYAPRAQAEQLISNVAQNFGWLFEKVSDEGFDIKDLPRILHSFMHDNVQDYRLITSTTEEDNHRRESAIYDRLVNNKRTPLTQQRANPLTAQTRFNKADDIDEVRDSAVEIFQRALEGKSVPSAQNAFEEPGFYPWLNKMKGDDSGLQALQQDATKQLGINALKGEITKAAGRLRPLEPKFGSKGQLQMRR